MYTSTFYRPWGNSALQFAWSWKLSCTCLCQGSWRHAAPRSEASDGKNKSKWTFLDQGKICNTTAATSMAKAMRQHVGRKDSILDVFGFALKSPLLYYISCPGRKRPFAFIFSIAGCRFVNFSSSKTCYKFCGTVIAALSCGRLVPSWHLPAADPNTKDQSRSSWPWPF